MRAARAGWLASVLGAWLVATAAIFQPAAAQQPDPGAEAERAQPAFMLGLLSPGAIHRDLDVTDGSLLIVNSGYGGLGKMPGNVMLVFGRN